MHVRMKPQRIKNRYWLSYLCQHVYHNWLYQIPPPVTLTNYITTLTVTLSNPLHKCLLYSYIYWPTMYWPTMSVWISILTVGPLESDWPGVSSRRCTEVPCSRVWATSLQCIHIYIDHRSTRSARFWLLCLGYTEVPCLRVWVAYVYSVN